MDDDNKYIKIEIHEKTREIELNEIYLNDIKIEINEKTREIDLNDIKIEINEMGSSTASHANEKNNISPITEIIIKCLKYTSDSYGVNPNTTLTHKTFEKNIFSRVDLYYERIDNDLFIAIRGTVTMYDVINDINIIQENMELDKAVAIDKVDETDLKVHKGFHQDFKDIKPFLRELIQENLSTGVTNIYFTGHSRGSSVSTLSALYIKTIYPYPDLNVYNIGFGCPRLGCENFANYYNKMLRDTTYLFREDLDIVTKLPIYGYYDILNQYIIKDKKVISIYEPHDSIVDFIESGLEHHRLKNYMNCDYILPNLSIFIK
jgi:hypothetical protein